MYRRNNNKIILFLRNRKYEESLSRMKFRKEMCRSVNFQAILNTLRIQHPAATERTERTKKKKK